MRSGTAKADFLGRCQELQGESRSSEWKCKQNGLEHRFLKLSVTRCASANANASGIFFARGAAKPGGWDATC